MSAIWTWLEDRPDRTAVWREWQKAADGAVDAIRPLLCPLERTASSYPNPRQFGLPMKVVQHASGEIVAIEEEDYTHRIPLTREDVVLYQLDLRAVRKMLCNTLDGLNIAKTPVDQTSRSIQIGHWELKKTARFPVYLLLGSCPNEFREQILQLANTKDTGSLLLTPTRKNWNEECEGIAASSKMVLVPLSEILEVNGDSFTESPNWEEYLQGFAQLVKLTLPGNYRTTKPTARRAELMAKVEKVKKALIEHIYSARDGVVGNIDVGRGAQLVRMLSKTDLARLADLKPYHVTRCFNADPQLRQLFSIANNPEMLLQYGKR